MAKSRRWHRQVRGRQRDEASLCDIGFRDGVTATMVYDKQAVLDHFRAVDDSTLISRFRGQDPSP